MAFTLKNFLGSRPVSGVLSVQPHLAETLSPFVTVGSTAKAFPFPGDSMTILTSPMYGSLDPSSFVNVENWGTPPYPLSVLNGGAPQIAANNAPNPAGVV